MCTVTYIKTATGFLLTSTRDEQAVRPTLAPKKYSVNGIDLVYPKDELAGGTWIAANNSGRYACLLNGAYKKHLRQANYA